MVLSNSNDNGRALEYALTNSLVLRYPNAILDQDTLNDQRRDIERFLALPETAQLYFQRNSHYFVNSVLETRIDSSQAIIELKRLKDGQGVEGDVTDIRLVLADRTHYNISLKHNHKAVKHQRPGALMKQLGIVDANINTEYKNKIKEIETRFYSKVLAQETEFNTAKARDPRIISDLYREICLNAISYINQYSGYAPSFFTFLVGRFDFDKVVVRENTIEVSKFMDITMPTGMSARIFQDSYIDLSFNNGFLFRMRLHTASSRFVVNKSLSLKFDTHLMSDSVVTDTFLVR